MHLHRSMGLEATPPHKCPYCSSDDIERVRRHGRVIDRLTGVFGLRLYHCLHCNRRFYDVPSKKAS
jgi:DNA-directed RNA polymerase subunit RPC12/RpoP